jgi:hypothetical protein
MVTHRPVDTQGADPGWEVTNAFIGSVSARVPITTVHVDPCELELFDVILTIRPLYSSHSVETIPNKSSEAQSTSQGQEELGDLAAGEFSALYCNKSYIF